MKFRQPKTAGKVYRPAPAVEDRRRSRWWLHALVLLALVLANLALYHRTAQIGFLSVDDPDYVQNNPLLEHLQASNLKRILAEPYFANYAPANLLSYALDVALAGGKSAVAIHWSNVLWNGWVVCMVYLLAFTLRTNSLIAASAALLFLLHPVHLEVVAWISSRKDLIATGFTALAMTCYLLYRRRPRSCAWWYAGSLLCFLLASAAKQSVLLLPAVMLVWDLLVENRRNWQMLADKVPFGMITLFFGWMTWQAQPSTNHSWHAFVPAATQFANLWLLTGLGQYTLYRAAPNPGAWSQIARFAIILAAPLVWTLPLLVPKVLNRISPQPALRHDPRGAGEDSVAGRVRAALCYWVLIQMVPPMLLNFIVPITDRYLYLPSVAVCILVADGVMALAGGVARRRWIGWAVLAGVAAVWGTKSWQYLNEWCDPRSVWYGAHLKTQNPQVFSFLGEIYQNAGERMDDFIRSGAPLQTTNELPLARAVLGEPASAERLRAEWLGSTPARTNSIAYRDQLWRLAWEQFEEAAAHRGTLSAPNLFMNRGRLLVRQGKADQAIPEFQKALWFAQTSTYQLIRQETGTHALHAIGVAYWNLRNYREAEKWLLQAQEAQRKSGRAWIPALDSDVERIKALAAQQP